MSFYIIKSSGEKEEFSLKKFRRSLRNSGAKEKLIKRIVEEVQSMHPKSTKEIHNYATRMLKKENRPVAARYNLKEALLELGPAGFPFEQFIARLFRAKGYKAITNKIIRGKCVSHEIDVIAQKDNQHYMIECKFHNRLNLKSNVKVPLYIHSRFQDVKASWEKKEKKSTDFHQAWIVTNTKFTSDAHAYAECEDITLLSFSRPKGESLARLIDTLGLHPITVLTTLSKKVKRQLIKDGLVLCRDAQDKKNILKKYGFSDKKIEQVIAEAKGVCDLS